METVFKNLICVSFEKKNRFSVINTDRLTLFGELIDACSANHTIYINKIYGQNDNFLSVKADDAYCALYRLNFFSFLSYSPFHLPRIRMCPTH
jgi:hypothetical protein